MENHDEQRIASDFFAGNGIKGRPAMVISACIDKCPVMYYAGQELGEKGMDNEGFSGIDGRSTIFDYWAPDTLSRWYKDGVLNDNHLTREEIDLKAFYSKLFNICCTEQSISNGLFFDLMYVNQDSPCFDTHKEYAFLRKHNDEMLLIVANFADKAQQSQVIIPEHAFSYLQIGNRGRVNAVELFTGQNVTIDLQPDAPINVQIPANGAIILKCKV
jgi:glycosidase